MEQHIICGLRRIINAIFGSHSFKPTEIPYLPVRVHPWRLTIILNSQSLGSCFQFEKASTPPPLNEFKVHVQHNYKSPLNCFLCKNVEEVIFIHKGEKEPKCGGSRDREDSKSLK